MDPAVLLCFLVQGILPVSLASTNPSTGGGQTENSDGAHGQFHQLTNFDPKRLLDVGTSNKTASTSELRWGKLRGKTQFDWLISKKNRDVNDVFDVANGKQQAFLNLLSKLSGEKISLQSIITKNNNSDNPQRSRNKRSTPKRRGHTIRNKRKHGRKSRKSTHRHKTKADTIRSKAHGESFRTPNAFRKQQHEDEEPSIVDVDAMDQIIMAMTLNQFMNKKYKNNIEEDEHSGDKMNSKNRPEKVENNDIMLKPKTHVNDKKVGQKNLNSDKSKMVNSTKTKTVLSVIGSSVHLLPVTSEGFSMDFTPEDNEDEGRWLDIPLIQDDMTNHRRFKRHTKSRPKNLSQQETSLQEQDENNIDLPDDKTGDKTSKDENYVYLHDYLKKLAKVLDKIISKEKVKKAAQSISVETRQEQSIAEKRYSGKSENKSRRAMYDIKSLGGNGKQDLELNFIPLNSPSLSEKDMHRNDSTNGNREMLPEEKSETSPLPTTSENEKNGDLDVKNKEEQMVEYRKHKAALAKQESQIFEAEHAVFHLKKTEKSNSSKPKSNNPVKSIVAKEVKTKDKECEKSRNILPMLKEFWKLASKHIDNVYFNRMRYNLLNAAMMQLSELLDTDTQKTLDNDLMKCLSPNDQSTLQTLMAEIRSAIGRLQVLPFSENEEAFTDTKQKSRETTTPFSTQEERTRFHTLQNIVNDNLMGPISHEGFRDKFESLSSFSQQNNLHVYYPAGPYCARVFDYYSSPLGLDQYQTLDRSSPLYQRQGDYDRCTQLCQFASKLMNYRPNIGIIETVCVKRLMGTLDNCECSRLHGSGAARPEMGAVTMDEQEAEQAPNSDDPAPGFTAKIATSVNKLFGRGEPIFTHRPQQRYFESFNPKIYKDDNDRVAFVPQQKSVPLQKDVPRSVKSTVMLSRSGLGHTMSRPYNSMGRFQKTHMGYFQSRQNVGNNKSMYFRQSKLPVQSHFIGQTKTSRTNPFMQFVAYPNLNIYPLTDKKKIPGRGPVYPEMATMNRGIDNNSPPMPRNSPVASSNYNGGGKGSDPMFSVVILVSGSRK